MSLPKPCNFDHHLGKCVLRRKPNIFKLFYKYEDIPNIYQLSAGMPNEKLFPIKTLQANTSNFNVLADSSLPEVVIEPNSDCIGVAMQYGQAGGLPDLRNWLTEFVSQNIECRYQGGFDVMATLGSTDGWYKVLMVLSNEWLDHHPVDWRQGIIVEEFTYSIASEVARVRGLNILSVSMDKEGIKPDVLERCLREWDPSQGQRPHILYTVSIGQNPTGATAGLQRRREIYEICQKYDVIIVEDEPYWFMQFDGLMEPCYLNIDTEGRVIRLDSFSKNFVPGARMGWVTAQPDLIQRIHELAEEATQQPSGFSQCLMLEALQQWTQKGWMQWLTNLKDEYESRRDIMVSALEKYRYVDDTLVLDFQKPAAGMFVWIYMRFESHPLVSKFSVLNLSRALWAYNATHKQPVLFTPGYFFAPSQTDAEHMASFIRLSYAPSEKENLAKESEGFGKNVAEFWKLKDEEVIKSLIEVFPA